jgi:RHS repeat-associated protein
VQEETGALIEAEDYDAWGVAMTGRSYLSGVGAKEGYTGKERDAETGLDYFGARYYLAAIGRWGAVDALTDRYPGWSPYTYVLNSPLRLVDPRGLDVIITGPDAAEAAKELDRQSSLKVKFDKETGKVTATGRPRNDADRTLLAAIENTNVVVKLKTTRASITTASDGAVVPIIVGLFDGSVREDRKVVTSQFVNLEQAKILEVETTTDTGIIRNPVGGSIRHEINESYLGALDYPGQPYNSASFSDVHRRASLMDQSAQSADDSSWKQYRNIRGSRIEFGILIVLPDGNERLIPFGSYDQK